MIGTSALEDSTMSQALAWAIFQISIMTEIY